MIHCNEIFVTIQFSVSCDSQQDGPDCCQWSEDSYPTLILGGFRWHMETIQDAWNGGHEVSVSVIRGWGQPGTWWPGLWLVHSGTGTVIQDMDSEQRVERWSCQWSGHIPQDPFSQVYDRSELKPEQIRNKNCILKNQDSYNKSSICEETNPSTLQYHKIRTVGCDMYLDIKMFMVWRLMMMFREAFKKNNDETYGKFHILGGGSARGHFPYVITKDFKCTESHFEHF